MSISTKKRGFYTAELVGVIAILAILAAVAFPAVSKIRNNLTLLKLDTSAKEIYMSAQSQIGFLESAGVADSLGGSAAFLDRPNPDDSVRYITSASDKADLLLPLGAIAEEVRQSGWIIEYNPDTALICGVFFWQEDSFDESRYRDLAARDQETRKQYPVGYYGGDENGTIDIPEESRLDARLEESAYGEDFYLRIDKGSAEGHVEIIVADLSDSSLAPVSVAAFELGHTDPSHPDLAEWAGVEGFHRVFIDSLNPDRRFSKLYPTFHPGCDLKITLKFTETGKSTMSRDFICNSLFDYVEGSSDKTAYIKNARQLQNLHVFWSDEKNCNTSNGWAEDGALRGVTGAQQTADITWPSGKAFRPITSTCLRSYDGKGHSIKELAISGNVLAPPVRTETSTGTDSLRGAGLFGFFGGSELLNISLENCTIRECLPEGGSSSGTGYPVYLGLLAGAVQCSAISPIRVENCHIYGINSLMDLGDASYCESGRRIQGAGGLVGFMGGTSQPGSALIKSCSASLPVLNVRAVFNGGLAGRLLNTDVSASYAEFGVRTDDGVWSGGISGGDNRGGLAGSFESTSSGTKVMGDCYTVGYIKDGGFGYIASAGSGSGSVATSYCAVVKDDPSGQYNFITDAFPQASGVTAGADAFCVADSRDFRDKKASATVISSEEIRLNGLTLLTGKAFSSKTLSGFSPASRDMTKPYGISAGRIYPLKLVRGQAHYGDWPDMGAITVDEIRLFSDSSCKDDYRVYHMLIPADQGSDICYYAKAYAGGEAVEAEISGSYELDNDTGVLKISAIKNRITYRSALQATEIPLRSNNSTGVTYVDLSCEDVTVRVPIEIARVHIEMSGTVYDHVGNHIDLDRIYSDYGKALGQGYYTFDEQRKTGDFPATISVEPSRDYVYARLDAIGSGGVDMIRSVADLKRDFDAWNKLKCNNPGPWSYISDPAVETPEDGFFVNGTHQGTGVTYYPYSDINGSPLTLKVRAADSGLGRVVARWSMDEKMRATYFLTVKGARVLIEFVDILNSSASYTEGYQDARYPTAFPKLVPLTTGMYNTITLTFIPHIFDFDHGAQGTYTWSIDRVSPGAVTHVTDGVTYPTQDLINPDNQRTGPATFNIPYMPGVTDYPSATYLVTLKWVGGPDNLSSSTYTMYLDITRQ